MGKLLVTMLLVCSFLIGCGGTDPQTEKDKQIQQLIDDLDNPDKNVRADAVSELNDIGGEKAIRAMIRALKDEDPIVRRLAAGGLSTISDSSAVEPLIETLRDKDEYVRQNAAEALQEIGDKRAVEPLTKVLEDRYRDVRWSAVRALAEFGDKTAVAPLVRALKDEDSTVRWAAAKALGAIGGNEAVEALRSLWKQDTNKHLQQAVAYGLAKITGDNEAITFLKESLHSGNWVMRQRAAEWLGKIGDKTAVGHLIEALKDNDHGVRKFAAKALGEIGDKRAIEPLIKALEDDDSTVRSSAAVALGDIGDEKALEPLRELWKKTEDGTDRLAIACGLFKINGDKDAFEFITEAIKSKDSYFQWCALETLEKIGNKEVIQPLISVLKFNDASDRHFARVALKKITKQDFSTDYQKWKAWYEKSKSK